jgi:membrane protease YdiL (CAAX protease family)
MTTATAAMESSRDEGGIPQYRLPMILFMFAWPLAWFSFLIYVIGPMLLRPDGSIPTWVVLMISFLGNGAELAVALIVLRREGYRLTLKALRERINWRLPDKLWKWVAALVVFVAAFALTMFTGQFNANLATVPGFIPPDWFPAIMNPLEEVNSIQEAYPDINLAGNFFFFLIEFVVYGAIFNIIGEELYYRGMLQPKMRGVFGKWAWVANAIGFMLKHGYFRWNFPGLLPAALAFSFAFGPLGSLPIAMIYHYLGNFLFPIILAVPVVFGAG